MNTAQPAGFSGESFSGGFIRQHNSVLSAAHQLADVVSIWGILALVTTSAGIGWTIPYEITAFVSSIFFHILCHKHGLYHSWRGQSLFAEAKSVYTAWLTVLGTMLTVIFLLNWGSQFSNIVVAYWAIAVPTFISFYRISTRLILREMRRAGINTRNIAIVGAKEPGLSLARSICSSPWMGMNIAGFYDDRVETGSKPLRASKNRDEKDLTVLGGIDALIQQARYGTYDDIYIALPMKEEESIRELVNRLSDSPCNVHMVPDVFTFKMLNATRREIGGLPVVSVYNSPFDGFDSFLKRAEDVILSSLILILIAIPMIVISIAVKLSSPGPIIFKQRRYGMNGEQIEVWKFRSMTTCEDGDQIIQAKRNDSRVTKLGAFLRKHSLDELPQFYNVLQGTMSIVGPRPHAVAHNEHYRQFIDGYMQRHLVKPGITGLAQVKGLRGETASVDAMAARVQQDLTYIRTWSLTMDLVIIGKTLATSFFHRSAY